MPSWLILAERHACAAVDSSAKGSRRNVKIVVSRTSGCLHSMGSERAQVVLRSRQYASKPHSPSWSGRTRSGLDSNTSSRTVPSRQRDSAA